MVRWTALLLAVWLVACGNGGGSEGPAGSVDPATLCVSSSCGTKTRLIDIPSAENLLFSDDGRLFVSGSENVYEITRDGTDWQATPLSAGGGSFGGLAQIGDVLYVNGFDGQLYAARLTRQPALQPIHDLGLSSPNGLSAGPGGELYVVDGPLSPSILAGPKIVRLRLDPADPMQVVEQADWLTAGLSFPNGMQRRGNTLVVADSSVLPVQRGAIRTVEIQADGSAGTPQTLGTFPSLPDDLGLVGDSVLVAYYSSGQIALMGPDGNIVSQTAPMSFDNPSSVRLGRPPLFAPGDLVVTEKGVVGLPPTPGYGNVLSVFRRN